MGFARLLSVVMHVIAEAQIRYSRQTLDLGFFDASVDQLRTFGFHSSEKRG